MGRGAADRFSADCENEFRQAPICATGSFPADLAGKGHFRRFSAIAAGKLVMGQPRRWTPALTEANPQRLKTSLSPIRGPRLVPRLAVDDIHAADLPADLADQRPQNQARIRCAKADVRAGPKRDVGIGFAVDDQSFR